MKQCKATRKSGLFSSCVYYDEGWLDENCTESRGDDE